MRARHKNLGEISESYARKNHFPVIGDNREIKTS